MKNTSLVILGLLFAVFGISLFMPWILLPNYEHSRWIQHPAIGFIHKTTSCYCYVS
jgi:hypothetical protein